MAAKKINQKFYPPTLAPGAGRGNSFSLSRSDFLDGTIKTYYGPGQPPDAGNPLVGYQPPTDWPAAGTPLYVPQIVWLSAYFHDLMYQDPTKLYQYGFLITPYLVYRRPTPIGTWDIQDSSIRTGWAYGADYPGGGVSIVIAQGHSDDKGNYGISYWDVNDATKEIVENTIPPGPTSFPDDYIPPRAYVQHYPNPYVPEYERILSVFREVKTQIEAKRPNRTWVEVNEWLDNTNRDNPAKYFLPLQEPDNPDDYYIYLVAPQDRSTYFGVNFLHVYVGDPTSVLGSVTADPFNETPTNDFTFMDSYTHLDYLHTSTFYQTERFAGFSIRLFSSGVTPTPLDIPPPETYTYGPKPNKTFPAVYYVSNPDFPIDPFGDHKIRKVYTIDPWAPAGVNAIAYPLFSGFDGPPPDHWEYDITNGIAAGQHGLDLFNGPNASQIISFNAGIIDSDTHRLAIFTAQTKYLSDRGIDAAYIGTSDEVTTESLIELIASHFNFDPDTGKDNG